MGTKEQMDCEMTQAPSQKQDIDEITLDELFREKYPQLNQAEDGVHLLGWNRHFVSTLFFGKEYIDFKLSVTRWVFKILVGVVSTAALLLGLGGFLRTLWPS